MKQLAATVALTCGLSLVNTAADFSIVEKSGETITVSYKSKPVVHLMTKNDLSSKETAHDTYKVYLHVNDPTSPSRTITKGAGDKFTHHRGIYIGWSKTRIAGKSYDTWHMKGFVRQVFNKMTHFKSGPDRASFTAHIKWVNGDEILLSEERTFTIHKPANNGAFLIDKQSKITAAKADTELNGDPEHAGCQFRASAQVVKNKSAKYIFPDGPMDQKSVIAARNLPWAAMTFKAHGNDYHVQHMTHSSVAKPVRYSAYRDYGRFGAFPVTKIKKGESATFKFRFYISPGAFPDSIVADCEKRHTEFN